MLDLYDKIEEAKTVHFRQVERKTEGGHYFRDRARPLC